MPRKKRHLSAGVILLDLQGRILLQLRDDNPEILYPNHWGITGGDAHKGESPEEAGRREVREETGLDLETMHPWRVYEEEAGGKLYETHFYYALTDVPLQDMVCGEGQELRFFHPDDLDDLDLAYRHREVLAEFVASTEYRSHFPDEALYYFQEAIADGSDWFTALLDAIARWQTVEEEVGGRRFRYLVGGEAFDWLLLAERLCESVDGVIPAEEKEALLFFGQPPREMDDDEFRRAIGSAKHRAHLNFLYGVRLEEALQLSVEQEVHKEHRTRVWGTSGDVEREVFERVYGRPRSEMLAEYRQQRGLPEGEDLSYGELREFTYWLFKYRVNQLDPARVASDTRKALAQMSELEAAARRRDYWSEFADVVDAVDAEVVAHIR